MLRLANRSLPARDSIKGEAASRLNWLRFLQRPLITFKLPFLGSGLPLYILASEYFSIDSKQFRPLLDTEILQMSYTAHILRLKMVAFTLQVTVVRTECSVSVPNPKNIYPQQSTESIRERVLFLININIYAVVYYSLNVYHPPKN